MIRIYVEAGRGNPPGEIFEDSSIYPCYPNFRVRMDNYPLLEKADNLLKECKNFLIECRKTLRERKKIITRHSVYYVWKQKYDLPLEELAMAGYLDQDNASFVQIRQFVINFEEAIIGRKFLPKWERMKFAI